MDDGKAIINIKSKIIRPWQQRILATIITEKYTQAAKVTTRGGLTWAF